jgi:uncharacterized protein YwqG
MSTNIPLALLPFKRKAWKPIVENRDGSLLASKFSGAPFLETAEEYPSCQNCEKPLQLFIQLNLGELPEPVQGEFGCGLLQMFYCTSEEPLCEVDCEAFFPFAKSVLVRIIQPNIDASSDEVSLPENSFTPKLIMGWEETEDYPNSEEGKSLGIILEDDEWDSFYEEEFPQVGDKLAGYPAWVQGIEYPNCPICGETMRLLFQIDSEDNLPYMFGDVGCGHITQCKIHTEQLAFGWACG